jgi:hypothetical protein
MYTIFSLLTVVQYSFYYLHAGARKVNTKTLAQKKAEFEERKAAALKKELEDKTKAWEEQQARLAEGGLGSPKARSGSVDKTAEEKDREARLQKEKEDEKRRRKEEEEAEKKKQEEKRRKEEEESKKKKQEEVEEEDDPFGLDSDEEEATVETTEDTEPEPKQIANWGSEV